MRRVDAPLAGWYPDPQNPTRLRWWDGLDWTDIRRAPPSDAELSRYEELTALSGGRRPERFVQDATDRAVNRAETQQLITEVRNVARAEVDRAAEEFSQRARTIVREVEPLVTSYSNRLIRWIKFASIFAVLLLIAWFVFQVVAQASLFEWIGDRIDNIFDDEQSAAALVHLGHDQFGRV